MSLFGDPKNKVINAKYIQELIDNCIPVSFKLIGKAKQGNPEAIYKIGCVYASKENMDMAILWLGTSSALGFYESQLRLCDLFKKDYPARALTWYKLALSNGVDRAGTRIGDELFKNRRYKDAEEEYIKAAENGDPYCQNHLGAFYRDGYYIKMGKPVRFGVDYKKAFNWFQIAADENYTEVQYNVAQLYENGQGVVRNKYTALHWYERSRGGGYKIADKCIESLNKEGYFYLPPVKNVSSLATTTETEAPKSTADMRRRVELFELKKS